MTDPRNIADDKEAASDEIARGADETPQPGRQPHMEHDAADSDDSDETDDAAADEGVDDPAT